MNENITYCGFIAIVGRSNVGKSTLFNTILGNKVSITSNKQQTTRNRIMGIHTKGSYQAIYLDTPGLHINEKRELNRLMNLTTRRCIKESSMIIFVVEGIFWTPDDNLVVNILHNIITPVILVINKVDNVFNKAMLLPHIKFLSKQMNFHDILPICAKRSMEISMLEKIIYEILPQETHHFPESYITNCSQNFIASEIIREKLICLLNQEMPYSSTVIIEKFLLNDFGGYDIFGLILVERDGQKKIIIGKKGNKIKTIRIESQKTMELLFKTRIHLNLWVKVKSEWSNNLYTLRNLGYF